VVMILLTLPMFFFGQETSGRNMEDLGTDTDVVAEGAAAVPSTASPS